jgi:hypothetical protein
MALVQFLSSVFTPFLSVLQREQQGVFESEVQRLQQELSTARAGVGAVESSLSTALAAKNAELENLTAALEGAKRQAAMAEGKLAALQVWQVFSVRSDVRNRQSVGSYATVWLHDAVWYGLLSCNYENCMPSECAYRCSKSRPPSEASCRSCLVV